MSATHAELESFALECESVVLRPMEALDLVEEHCCALTALSAAGARIDQLEATLRDLTAAAEIIVDGDGSWSEFHELSEVIARARQVQS